MTVPYAEVIGDPIAHSKSPLIHKFWLDKLGLEGDYRATRVAPEALHSYFAERRSDPQWRGSNVTIPHKAAAVPFAHGLVPPVDRIGAANCIVREAGPGTRLVAYNTDVSGFLDPLRDLNPSASRMIFAHVVGTGGAAAAVTYALGELGFTTYNYGRTAEKSLELRHRLREPDDDFALDWNDLARGGSVLDGEDSAIELLVNATPMGMDGFPTVPVDLDLWAERVIVYDLVYAPLETPLLAAARQRGMRTVDGLQMLVGQAAAAFEIFFGQAAPREHDAELRELLTR